MKIFQRSRLQLYGMKENIFSYKVTMEKIRFCVCFSDFSEIYFIRKNLKIKIKDFLFII